MTYQIADAKTRYFNDKQHYVNFLKAWARAVNSPNVKATKDPRFGNKVGGWVQSEHVFLYALLRGKDINSAFTPITNETRLENGHYQNNGLFWAHQGLRILEWKIERIEKLEKGESRGLSNWYEQDYEQINNFLAPFNGTVDLAMLKKVLEDIKQFDIKAVYREKHVPVKPVQNVDFLASSVDFVDEKSKPITKRFTDKIWELFV